MSGFGLANVREEGGVIDPDRVIEPVEPVAIDGEPWNAQLRLFQMADGSWDVVADVVGSDPSLSLQRATALYGMLGAYDTRRAPEVAVEGGIAKSSFRIRVLRY